MLDFARHDMPYTTDWIKRLWFDQWSGEFVSNPKWRDLQDEATSYRSWREIKAGVARGMAIGGNSEAFMQLVDTPYCPALDGSVLFLETYRLQKRHIQALFSQLKLHRVLDRIGGLVIGYCLGSDAAGPGNDRDIVDLVRDAASDYDFPAMQIGEVGHQVENLILPLGATVQMDTHRLSLALDEPAVV